MAKPANIYCNLKPNGTADSQRPLLWRDRRTGAIGYFVMLGTKRQPGMRMRPGHARRDRNFHAVITTAKDILFQPVEVSAAYYVPANIIGRKFEALPGEPMPAGVTAL